ncbi:hypothetical protein M3196_00355 [Fictibacillus nanhaiensis]|uniref:hypothetical protein n=1 Tax=Fictibacillus nanhaiensis TaxID=742169 RepID=UPI002041FA48|nr:hypothetical protein [Fictibacillus nanhaiensis]MCM3730119.1 hypothetical protein [Fictibacillus nanhaiensis]
MKLLIINDKVFASCILALVKDSKLGLVRIKGNGNGSDIEIEVSYPEESKLLVKSIKNDIENNKMTIDVKELMYKYRYVDNLVRAKISKCKRDN